MRVVYKEPIHDRIMKEIEKARWNNQTIERIYLTREEMDEFKDSHVGRSCARFECDEVTFFLYSVEIKEEP